MKFNAEKIGLVKVGLHQTSAIYHLLRMNLTPMKLDSH